MSGAYALSNEAAAEVFDSGYTVPELDRLFESLTAGHPQPEGEDGLALALAIGLADGDLTPLSERGTVMLETPRAELDRRIAAIRARLDAGDDLAAAVEAVVG